MSTVNEKMTALANEVRELSGGNELLGIVDMTNVLSTENDHFDNNITTQEGLITQISTLVATKANPPSTDTSDATATAEDILSGKTAYVNSEKITGNIVTKTSSNLTVSGATVTVPVGYYASQATKSVATATQATPSISINANGLITSTATQDEGYVSAGTKSGTKQLTTKAATTYTPGTANQTIASGTYLTGTQTIRGDVNLVAENIKSGISIFGVIGSYEGSGGSSSGGGVETCTLTVLCDAPLVGDEGFIFINGNQEISTGLFPGFGETSTYTVQKNSLIYLINVFANISGNCSNPVFKGTTVDDIVFITGDATVTIM